MAISCKVSIGIFATFALVFAIFTPAVQGQGYEVMAPAPAPTNDGRPPASINPADPGDLQRWIEAVERIQMLTSLDGLGLKKMDEIKMEQGINLTIEGKIQSLERELDVRNRHQLLYNQVVTELKVKLSESELREGRLRECLQQAKRELQRLRDRVLDLEFEKRSSAFRMEKLAREKSEACLMLLEKDEILKESERRSSVKLLELEKEVDLLKKTKQSKSVIREEKLKESLAEAKRSLEELRARVLDSEVEKKTARFIIEELRREKLEADEIVNESRRMNLKAREAVEVNLERFGNVIPTAENLFKLLKRNVKDLVGMKDMLLGEGHETDKHRLTVDDRGEEVVSSRQGLKRKRSETSPLLRKRLFGADMARAFHEDDDMCVEAVCTLYRQHMSDSESSEGSKQRFYHFERLWRHCLENFLIQGDPELRVTRPVAEVKQQFPHIVNLCRRLAIEYSSYFIAMPRTPTSGQDKMHAFSLCLVRLCCYTDTDSHDVDSCEMSGAGEGEDMSLDDIIEIPDH